MMALAALLLDFIFDTLRQQPWARVARLVLALVVAGTSLPLAWRQVQERQTNVDLIAAKLGQLAAKEDLIVVSLWPNGISFERYYRGAAPWMTIPPLDFHQFHRYDLVKAQMTQADQDEPVKPLLQKISETLQGGHRVWVAGLLAVGGPGDPLMHLSPAPDPQRGWHDVAYSRSWSMKTASYLRAVARHRQPVPIACPEQVNPLEDLQVNVFDGWSELASESGKNGQLLSGPRDTLHQQDGCLLPLPFQRGEGRGEGSLRVAYPAAPSVSQKGAAGHEP